MGVMFLLQSLLLAAVPSHSQQQSSASCHNFVVRARLDNVPEDFVVRITSAIDGSDEWRTQPRNDPFEEVMETTCLDPSKCWKATVFDSEINKDGLTVLEDNDDIAGGYFLTFGSEIVGSYDGTLHPRPCFEQHWYVFGDGCEPGFAPMEGIVAESNCLVTLTDSIQDNGEDIMCLNLKLQGVSGEFPEHSRFKLEDTDGAVLWDEAAADSFSTSNQAEISVSCLDSKKCYRLTFFDSTLFPERLAETIPQSRDQLSFTIIAGDHVAGSYNSTSDGCYAAIWYQFGTCPGGETSAMIGSNICTEEDVLEDNVAPSPPPCEPFVFSIFTDEYPMDVSYKLTNADGVELWNVQPNTLTDQNSLYRRESCLSRDDCYVFALYDSETHQDGLTEVPTGGVAGWYKVDYQGSTLGYYDGSIDGCYRAKGFRFGDRCPMTISNKWSAHGQCKERPEIYESAVEKEVGCVGFQFYIRTDEFPEHSRIQLTDAYGAVIWDEQPWGPNHTNQIFDRDICLNPFDCYNFTLYDSELQSDGLTKVPVGGTPGMFNLTFGSTLIASYDGAEDGCFSSVWYLFGELCQTEIVRARIAGRSCQITHPKIASDSDSPTLQNGPVQDVEECIPLIFVLLHDEFPEDVIVRLETDSGENIWNFEHQWSPVHAGEAFAETICLDPSLCYHFQIDDVYDDGLTKPTDQGVGQFSLVFGSSVIDAYNGTYCFSSIWYQFGAHCEQEKIMESSSSCGDKQLPVLPNGVEDCDPFSFDVQLDEFPEDVVLMLNTSEGREVWSNVRPWGPKDAGRKLERTDCLARDECYIFSVFDEYDDGLTKQVDGSPTGSFNVTYGVSRIGSYDARYDDCYSVFWFQFGSGCPFFPQTIAVAEEVSVGDCRDERRN